MGFVFETAFREPAAFFDEKAAKHLAPKPVIAHIVGETLVHLAAMMERDKRHIPPASGFQGECVIPIQGLFIVAVHGPKPLRGPSFADGGQDRPHHVLRVILRFDVGADHLRNLEEETSGKDRVFCQFLPPKNEVWRHEPAFGMSSHK